MIPNAAEADATSAIGEFGKIFSGAGAHIIRTSGDRKGGRAFWEVRNKISTKIFRKNLRKLRTQSRRVMLA